MLTYRCKTSTVLFKTYLRYLRLPPRIFLAICLVCWEQATQKQCAAVDVIRLRTPLTFHWTKCCHVPHKTAPVIISVLFKHCPLYPLTVHPSSWLLLLVLALLYIMLSQEHLAQKMCFLFRNYFEDYNMLYVALLEEKCCTEKMHTLICQFLVCLLTGFPQTLSLQGYSDCSRYFSILFRLCSCGGFNLCCFGSSVGGIFYTCCSCKYFGTLADCACI